MDTYTLERAVNLFENMALADFASSPSFRFIKDLRAALREIGRSTPGTALSEGEISTLISQCEINLSEYDAENPLFKRLIAAYVAVIRNARTAMMGIMDPTAFLSRCSLKLDL